MNKLLCAIGLGVLLLFPASLIARQDFKTLDAIKIDGDSVVMTLSGKIKFHAFKISDPPRLVVELINTEYNASRHMIRGSSPIVERIRGAQYKNEPVKVARIVLDLKKSVDYQIKENNGQLIIKLNDAAQAVVDVKVAAAPGGSKAEVVAKPVEQKPAVASQKTADAKAQSPAPKPDTKTIGKKAAEPLPQGIKGGAVKPETAKTTAVKVSPTPSVREEKIPQVTVISASSTAQSPLITSKKIDHPIENKKFVEVIAQPIAAEPPSASSAQRKKSGVVKKKAEQTPKAKTVAETEKAAANVEQSQVLKAGKASLKQPETADKQTTPPVTENVPAASTPVPQAAGHVVLSKKSITIDFEDAEIGDVFRILSAKSGINIIYGSDIIGTISLRLENVPFDRAFETVLSLKGLVSQEQGPNILRIVTPQKISEERAQAVAFTKIFPLNYAKAEEIKVNLDTVRTAEGRRGNVTVDVRTNSLIVTDTPEGLLSVERIIGELDKKPQQVIIEAKLVEVVLTDSLDLGIEWAYARTIPTTGGVVTIGQSAVQTVATQGTGGTALNGEIRTPDGTISGGAGVSFPAVAVNGQMGAISFGLVQDSSRLTTMISALAQKGLSKLLSNPKVTTINNRQARIMVGQKIPYTTTTVAASGSTQQTNFLDVGIKLSVTPTINVNRKITLEVHPEVSLFIRADPAGPVIGTREAETTVIVSNGETVVIGGLITEDDRKLGTQVPLLGDIPVIGQLFKRNYDTKERSELLVFLTPQIIE
jgi:type IV pilus assembly protein PilQ